MQQNNYNMNRCISNIAYNVKQCIHNIEGDEMSIKISIMIVRKVSQQFNVNFSHGYDIGVNPNLKQRV